MGWLAGREVIIIIGMLAFSSKVFRPPVLSPGGLRITASPAGVNRVELRTDLRSEWGTTLASGPPSEVLDQAIAELVRYFDGFPVRFETPLDLASTGDSFQTRIWRSLREIPYGQTCTYGDLAREVGMPGAARAAGQAVGRNPLPLFLPCHRVVGCGGHLTGFSSGLLLKVKLLELEGIEISPGTTSARRRILA